MKDEKKKISNWFVVCRVIGVGLGFCFLVCLAGLLTKFIIWLFMLGFNAG